ncbi:MAG: pilus assembly protein TadG-related protein [Eubacteriales bacterium]|nr:pilus assembly protein TadG-related protein [Eubacteriales bacterium]
MRFIKQWLKHEFGQSALLVAISIATLCGAAALVVDVGMVSVTQGRLQNAADAAALAAARSLPNVSSARSTAEQYAELNGVAAGNTTTISPYNGEADKVEVVCTETMQYAFARILGMQSQVISARAVAESSGTTTDCFGYALFSGGAGMLYSNNLQINGSIHANGSIQIAGNNQEITGNAEAVTKLEAYITKLTIGGTCQAALLVVPDNSGSVSVASRLSIPAEVIDMPDLSGDVRAEADAAGTTYLINEWETQVFSGNGINIDQSIYVTGGVTIAGNSFKGDGVICAKKNIGISGNTLKSTADSAVCIYSVDGDISISSSGLTIYGTLYAPNGKIGIYGDNITIYGRVVAKEIIITGTNIAVSAGSGDLNFLPKGSVRLCE